MVKLRHVEYASNSLEETLAIAKEIGRDLSGGEVLALYGDLGAGKTAFTQGLASGLGIKDGVNSPTFGIIKIHSSKKRKLILCHIDAYRLLNERDLLGLGVEDYLSKPRTITVIEWADRVENLLPNNTIRIFIKNKSLNNRSINIKQYQV
ncbi:MAG: tRNA (adenosine(37)-N6)-threonylcarbamoyltransferase complex ATPase subunit type 1 TsaE [Clostridia bacterium]|nr:tRNA (adenosine(37)-N6)-threonylcarbamoyltransferase complex ATPase subunit type 1 TsaE [Clostridia bacterium]